MDALRIEPPSIKVYKALMALENVIVLPHAWVIFALFEPRLELTLLISIEVRGQKKFKSMLAFELFVQSIRFCVAKEFSGATLFVKESVK